MEIDSQFLTAAAFRFEAARGVRHSDFETEIITELELDTIAPDDLAHTLWDWLGGKGADSPLRSSAYWALGKRHDPRDLTSLVAVLHRELPRDADAVYQILIALENLGEPVFPPEQRGRSSRDHESNRAAAQRYLNQRQ